MLELPSIGDDFEYFSKNLYKKKESQPGNPGEISKFCESHLKSPLPNTSITTKPQPQNGLSVNINIQPFSDVLSKKQFKFMAHNFQTQPQKSSKDGVLNQFIQNNNIIVNYSNGVRVQSEGEDTEDIEKTKNEYSQRKMDEFHKKK